ncbi:MAG: DNA-processing protein DprA, partial [Caulobacter sp.]
PNVGPVAFDHLTNRFGSARAALDALPRLVQRGAVPQPPSADEVRRELEAGDRLGARLILSREPGFPPLLAALDPPPPLIWVLGEAAMLSRPAVGVVGARVASAAG